jgi:hypothetical protein
MRDSERTEIAADGLRYRSKEGGSPFSAKDSFSMHSMSCFLCGRHKPRASLTSRQLIGRARLVCGGGCSNEP